MDGTLAIGSTSERNWTIDDADDKADALVQKALLIMPELAGTQVIERWAGVRPRANTRAPLLGAWPGRPGHFVANGGYKIGFGIAPKVADVIADLVLDGSDAIPGDFKPMRSDLTK
jgi:glycine/D-amino acid oxidase-like deaminating enzyme